MGFIGIDRRLREHWIYQDAEYLKVWMEMLFLARFSREPGTMLSDDGQLIEMEYSWFVFGRIKWSDRLGISERRLRTLMDKLIDEKMISLVKRAPKFSIYCVTNFDKYRPSNDQQETLEPQGFELHGDQQNDQQATSKRPASDQQATTKEQGNNKVNNVNKVKKEIIYTPQFDEFWLAYPKPVEKVDCFATWQKIIKDGETPEIIIQCAKNYSQYCLDEQTESRFIKHPKTFLNKQRYQEYLTQKLKVVHGGGNSGKYGRGNERTASTNGFNKAELESLYIGSPQVRVQQV